MTIVALLRNFFSWFDEIKKTNKDNINDNVIKFFIFFFATKKKNFKSPTSKTFTSELILSIMINLFFNSFIQ